MKPAAILGLLGLLGLSALSQASRVRRDYSNNDYYVLHLERGVEPELVASRLGLEHQGQLGSMAHHHVFRAAKADDDIVHIEMREHRRRKRDLGASDILDGVLLAEKQKPRRRLEKRIIPPPPAGMSLGPRAMKQPIKSAVERQKQIMSNLGIGDPIFKDQWHLLNTVQAGHDVNVTGLWEEGITGHNVTVAIIDDGLDMNSNDLRDNYFAEGSYDFNEHDPEPRPELSDDKHGTRCAGEVAAVRNDVCGVGVAYDSKIAGIRILSGELTNADEAEALIYEYQLNNIYSCSWGPPDDGRHMEAPGVLIRQAMLDGIQNGRAGLGSIYVFASGNGAAQGDNCNFDGYTNSIYSITVGAVDRAGKHPYYSEHCSANLVVTYSSGSGDSIHTTDVGENACYSGHGGTSAAAPLAAGIFALALQVRPELTWRDLQYIALHTAIPILGEVDDWQETSIGKQFSHTFGYGKIDSYALVQLAKDWELVKPQAWYFSPWQHVKKAIPQGGDGLSVEFHITETDLLEANLERIEHVTVTMNVEHTRRGDLSVDLISPNDIVSHIATSRMYDEENAGYDDWTFMSVAHWGELGTGVWKLVIKDNQENEHQGTFIDWHLKLWGEATDPARATLLPMPQDDDDADHDKIIPPAQTAVASTAPAPPQPEETHGHDPPVASEQPHRPTKHTTNPAAEPTAADGNAPEPTSSVTQEEGPSSTMSSPGAATTSPSSSWISWLPTLGASKAAQPWIYGAVGMIGAFCVGLGIAFWIIRRRRLQNDASSEYDFQMLDEEEGEGLNTGEKTYSGGRRTRRKRGGELYDAFAAGSDDEDDFDQYSDRSSDSRLPGERSGEQYVVGDDSDGDDDADDEEQGGAHGRRGPRVSG